MCESWISLVSNIFTPVLDCLSINHKLYSFYKITSWQDKEHSLSEKNEWNKVIFTKQKAFWLLVILLCIIKNVLWIMYDWIYFRVTGKTVVYILSGLSPITVKKKIQVKNGIM